MKKGIVFFLLTFLFLFIPNLKADHTMQIIVKMVGPDSTSNMGTTVAGLGDINHDGFDDVGVSVYGNKKIFIYYGGNPMDSIPDLILRGSWSVASARDVNGDGYKDMMTSDLQNVYIYYGSETGLDTIIDVTIPGEFPQDLFGWYLIPATDVNKDTYDDILILAPNYLDNGGDGKAYLYYGGNGMDTIPDWQFSGHITSKRVQSVCALDLNGDNWIDIVVGKVGHYYMGTDSLPGEIDIFWGGNDIGDTIPDLIINPHHASNYLDKADFGWWVSNLGDFNSDGFEDLAILLSDICGDPYVYFGGNPPDTLPSLLLGESLTRSDNYTCGGDVNGDGFMDIVNGNICWGMGWGAVELYLGGPKFDAKNDRWMTADDLPPDFLERVGRCVTSAGDVNGDGIDDIIFSAENFWPTNRGEVFILAGDTSIHVGVKEDDPNGPNQPYDFELQQNYPNPFNAVTSIQFTVAGAHASTHISLKIYNLSGQLIRNLVEGERKPGTCTITWDGKNSLGKDVASGIYFYQIRAKDFQSTKRMLMIK